MAPYSMDLRTRVLADRDAGVATQEVAAKFRVSVSWVNRIVQGDGRRARSRPANRPSLNSKRLPAKKIGSARRWRPSRIKHWWSCATVSTVRRASPQSGARWIA